MKIHYTGKLEKLDAASQKKLDVRFARLSKLLDKKSEKELHVILKSERHLQRAELTLNVDGQPQAGIHAATDQLTALSGACDKLEKQLLKQHDKRLGNKRRAGKPAVPVAVSVAVNGAEPPPSNYPKVSGGTLAKGNPPAHRTQYIDFGPEYLTKGIIALVLSAVQDRPADE